MNSIRVLWPTIRPEEALRQSARWLELSANPDQVEIIFGVNTNQDWIKIGLEKRPHSSAFLFKDARPGVTATATELSRLPVDDSDIIVLASDDFEAFMGWDRLIALELSGAYDALIADGYKIGTNIVPIPIVNGVLLKRLNGILYHPDYRHFISDQELFDVLTEMRVIKDRRGCGMICFQHRHWSFKGRKKDQFDERNNTWWNEDKATYERRKKMSLEEKLRIK